MLYERQNFLFFIFTLFIPDTKALNPNIHINFSLWNQILLRQIGYNLHHLFQALSLSFPNSLRLCLKELLILCIYCKQKKIGCINAQIVKCLGSMKSLLKSVNFYNAAERRHFAFERLPILVTRSVFILSCILWCWLKRQLNCVNSIILKRI